MPGDLCGQTFLLFQFREMGGGAEGSGEGWGGGHAAAGAADPRSRAHLGAHLGGGGDGHFGCGGSCSCWSRSFYITCWCYITSAFASHCVLWSFVGHGRRYLFAAVCLWVLWSFVGHGRRCLGAAGVDDSITSTVITRWGASISIRTILFAAGGAADGGNTGIHGRLYETVEASVRMSHHFFHFIRYRLSSLYHDSFSSPLMY